MNTIYIKRVYDEPSDEDGYRVLVDRLWPRGISKKGANLDEWNKEVAPSTALRKWFDHKEALFDEFTKLYCNELLTKKVELNRLRTIAKKNNITLLYGAKNVKINHAIILKDVLLEKMLNK
jgi:uncharacterized protein YeaO (DUF488 family)